LHAARLLALVLLSCSIAAARMPQAADAPKAADSAAVALPDSIQPVRLPPFVGTVDRSAASLLLRTRDDLHWLDFRFLGNILETIPGGFMQSQEGEGQYHAMTFDGTDWRGIAFMTNGRPLSDPASGVYNMYLFPPEFADRVEVVTGPRAFLYGFNAAGGAVNLVTKNYNSNKPFTKLDYSESAYGYAYADGTFSQNISRRVNVTFGFQHQATDGRYANSLFDGWMSRAKLRFSLSPAVQLLVAHTYAATRTGLNGGIDLAASGGVKAFDNIQAVVRNPDSYEKVSRHDVDCSLVGTLFGDSADVSTLTLYYSHALREYRDEENRALPNGILVHADHLTSWMGALITQNIDTRVQRLLFGASVDLRRVEASPNLGRQRGTAGAVWLKEEADLGDNITLAGFGRLDSYRGRTYAGVGADATLRLSPAVTLFGGLSTSRRAPTYQELFWQDSTIDNPGGAAAEVHRVAEAGVRFALGNSGGIRLAAFHRTIQDPIDFTPIAKPNAPFPTFAVGNGAAIASNGVNVNVDLRVGVVALEGNAEYIVRTQAGTRIDDVPRLWAHGGVYYWNKLLHDNLELKTGVSGSFMLSHAGDQFNPEVIAYVPSGGPSLGTSGTIDFFLIAHLGDAYIHFIWENLPDIRYYGIPFTPAGERALRFGISWEFLN
jgi:outer membrane cobalamin receptor